MGKRVIRVLGKTEPMAGEYQVVEHGGVRLARLACPKCGVQDTLPSIEYAVDSGGRVTPQYFCSCGFGDYLLLDAWRD